MPFQTTTLHYFQLARGLREFLLCSGFILQYSIISQYSHTLHLPLNQGNHLLYLTRSHLCSPAALAAPPHTQRLGRQKRLLCFHFTRDLIPQSSLHLPQGQQMAGGSAL